MIILFSVLDQNTFVQNKVTEGLTCLLPCPLNFVEQSYSHFQEVEEIDDTKKLIFFFLIFGRIALAIPVYELAMSVCLSVRPSVCQHFG